MIKLIAIPTLAAIALVGCATTQSVTMTSTETVSDGYGDSTSFISYTKYKSPYINRDPSIYYDSPYYYQQYYKAGRYYNSRYYYPKDYRYNYHGPRYYKNTYKMNVKHH